MDLCLCEEILVLKGTKNKVVLWDNVLFLFLFCFGLFCFGLFCFVLACLFVFFSSNNFT